MTWGRPRILRGEGEGTTFYAGDRTGAPYIALDLRGFNGWRSSPQWMPGGWEYFQPRLYVGRLYMDRGRSYGLGTLLVPAKVWDFYRWRIKPSGRRYMREHGHDQPQAVASEGEQTNG